MDVFLAVIIIILVMNSFLFIVFKGIAANVGKQAQNCLVRQLSAYDGLIEKKARKLQEIKSALPEEQVQQTVQDSGQQRGEAQTPINPFAISPGNFLDDDFLHNYRMIRDFFHFDYSLCIKEVLQQYDTTKQDLYSLLGKQILDRFSLEERFSLSILEEEDQLRILEEILQEDEFSLLEEYRTFRGTFNCLDFFDWLATETERSNSDVIVRTGKEKDNLVRVDERIKTEYDAGICEGIQIILRNKLYDFSIRKKEISG